MDISEIISSYKAAVVQIATPYSTGTGFYVVDYDLVVTNEHVVRDNREVVVIGQNIEKQLAKTVYLDVESDLAFLKLKSVPSGIPSLKIYNGDDIDVGISVIAVGHPFGLQFSITKGIVSSLDHKISNINFIQHDAALNPGNSGGPLIDQDGVIIGVNTFIVKNGNNIGFSLPYKTLQEDLDMYAAQHGQLAVKCNSCGHMVYEKDNQEYCNHCGTSINTISSIASYEPQGVNKSLESMIGKLGYDVLLSRTGPSSWSLQRGSAYINICYHEKTGLITGDSHLCELPDEDILSVYTFLLEENYKLDGLTFSVKDHDIILSLLIFDQYFEKDNAEALFENLFQLSDHYDDILVDEYGAKWNSELEG